MYKHPISKSKSMKKSRKKKWKRNRRKAEKVLMTVERMNLFLS